MGVCAHQSLTNQPAGKGWFDFTFACAGPGSLLLPSSGKSFSAFAQLDAGICIWLTVQALKQSGSAPFDACLTDSDLEFGGPELVTSISACFVIWNRVWDTGAGQAGLRCQEPVNRLINRHVIIWAVCPSFLVYARAWLQNNGESNLPSFEPGCPNNANRTPVFVSSVVFYSWGEHTSRTSVFFFCEESHSTIRCSIRPAIIYVIVT